MTIEATIAKIEALEFVNSVRIWKGKRAYINLAGFDAGFAGCRSHQLYIDMATGNLVDQKGKGTTPRAFDDQCVALAEAI